MTRPMYDEMDPEDLEDPRIKKRYADEPQYLTILPWAKFFDKRCKAVLEERNGDYWGRCELRVQHGDMDHALERGMETPRWSTYRTG